MITWGIASALMAFIFEFILIFWLKDSPNDVKCLTPEENKLIIEEHEQEIAAKNSMKKYTLWQALGDKTVLKLSFIYFMWITVFGDLVSGCQQY